MMGCRERVGMSYIFFVRLQAAYVGEKDFKTKLADEILGHLLSFWIQNIPSRIYITQ